MHPTDPAAFATTVIDQLNQISHRLQADAGSTEERFAVLVDTCEKLKLDLSEASAFDFVPSPLLQLIETMHDRIRWAEYNLDANSVVLHHFNVSVPAVGIPMDLFDPSLAMLHTLWQTSSFPYRDAKPSLRLVK